MTAPLISVIVPTFNGERFIGETIDSIVAQTWRPIEIILVDDGSTDATVAVATSRSDLVRVVRQERGGPAAARNLGIAAARGDFLAFLDHDDLWVPQKLALQFAAFEADPELDVCVAHVQRFLIDATSGDRRMLQVPVPGYASITMLARRVAFDQVGSFDATRICSDSLDWFLRLDEAGLTTRLLPDLLTLHREHDANYSLLEGDRSRKEFLHLLKSRIERQRGQRRKYGANP